MSESHSFIEEVSAELRREHAMRLLRRWGWVAIALVVLIVGGAAWNEWRKAQAVAAAEAFGDALSAAEDAPALAALNVTDPEQRAVARLGEAAAHIDAGDDAAARAVLAALAADTDVDPVYRDLADLKALALDPLYPETGDRAAVIARLATPGNAFRPLALEQRALDDAARGETEAALATLDELLSEGLAPPALTQRAIQLQAALGGDDR